MAVGRTYGTVTNAMTPLNTVGSQSITVPANTKEVWLWIEADDAANSGTTLTYARIDGVDMTLEGQTPSDVNGMLVWAYSYANPTAGAHTFTWLCPAKATIASSEAFSTQYNLTTNLQTGVPATTSTPSTSISSSSIATITQVLAANNVMASAVTETGGQSIGVECAGNAVGECYLGLDYKAGSATTTASWSLTGGSQKTTTFSLEVYDDGPIISSINGGSPVRPGQTGVSCVCSNFGGVPTGGSISYYNTAKGSTQTLSISNIGGTATNPTFDLEDRSEGVDYPAYGDTLTLTLTYLATSGSGNTTLGLKTGELTVNFASAITSDSTYITYWFNYLGYTVEGAQFDYVTGPKSIVFYSDGSWTSAITPSDGIVQTTGWLRPLDGTGEGNVYAFTITLTSSSITVSVGGARIKIGIGIGISI